MLQDLHQVSDIQRYPVGLSYPRLDVLDLRRFHYGQALNQQIPDVGSHISLTQHVAWGGVAGGAGGEVVDAPVGSRTVVVTVGAADGAAHNGAIAENELRGGYCRLIPHVANHVMHRMIRGNTAVAAPGGAMTITLDRPTDFVLELVSHCECMANPFLLLEQGGLGNLPRQPIMGLPMVGATPLQFLWYQTWGPSWAAPQGLVGVGDHNVQLVFRHDGSIDRHNDDDPMLEYAQHAGFVMTIPSINLDDPAAQAAPFIFLQITP